MILNRNSIYSLYLKVRCNLQLDFNSKKPATPPKTNSPPTPANNSASTNSKAGVGTKCAKVKSIPVFTGKNDIEDKKAFGEINFKGENKYEFYSIPGDYVEKKQNQTITTFNCKI